MPPPSPPPHSTAPPLLSHVPPVGHRICLHLPSGLHHQHQRQQELGDGHPHTLAPVAWGFVRYRGPLLHGGGVSEGADQQWWVGIEWDDVRLGKHDGVAFGVRYFRTRPSPASSDTTTTTTSSSSSTSSSATFVKLERCVERMRGLPRPKSLLEAIRVRYLGAGDGTKGKDDGSMTIVSGRRVLRVELVGEDRVRRHQARLHEMEKMTLQGMGISSIVHGPNDGHGNEVEEEGEDDVKGEAALLSLCPQLRDVDLSHNLLHSWSHVLDLCRQLPHLRSIHLSGNRFPDISSSNNNDSDTVTTTTSLLAVSSPHASAFPGVQVLVLNNAEISWQQAETVKDYFPALQEMHLVGNEMHNIDIPTAALAPTHISTAWTRRWESLRVMELSNNAITDWGQVWQLASLTYLQRLHLNNNKISRVEYHHDGGNTDDNGKPFSSLQVLLLGNNEIDSWHSVNQMNRFPALQEVRLDGNPLTKSQKDGHTLAQLIQPQGHYTVQHSAKNDVPKGVDEKGNQGKATIDTNRVIAIAKISRLTSLNGSVINNAERRDSEIYYLKQSAQERIDNNESLTDQDFSNRHPRYTQLAQQYGDPFEMFQRYNEAQSKKSRVLEVTLVNRAESLRSKKTKVVKKLLPTTTVLQVKRICQRAFKLDVKQQMLHAAITESSEHGAESLELLDDDNKDIAYFGVVTGTVLYMDEADQEKERDEATIRDIDLAQRMAQQERDAVRQIQWQRDQFAAK